MKKAMFIILWMLAAFFAGCTICVIVLVLVNFVLAAQGVSLSAPTPMQPGLFLLLSLIAYGSPVIALILGIRGKLPGTGNDKSASVSSAPPKLPPILSSTPGTANQLSPDDIGVMWDAAIKKKFGQDQSLLSPELFETLLRCIVLKKTFNLTSAQSGRPSDQDIGAFEQTIGFALPQDFRAFVKTGFGCLLLEVNESVWPRPKPGDIVPAWHMMYRIYVYGLSTDVPVYMDIRKQFEAFSKGGRRIVPFLRREGYLDHYCFTPEGGIVFWDAEMREAKPVDLSFTALLIKEIRTLDDNAKKIQNEPNPYAEFINNPKKTGQYP